MDIKSNTTSSAPCLSVFYGLKKLSAVVADKHNAVNTLGQIISSRLYISVNIGSTTDNTQVYLCQVDDDGVVGYGLIDSLGNIVGFRSILNSAPLRLV